MYKLEEEEAKEILSKFLEAVPEEIFDGTSDVHQRLLHATMMGRLDVDNGDLAYTLKQPVNGIDTLVFSLKNMTGNEIRLAGRTGGNELKFIEELPKVASSICKVDASILKTCVPRDLNTVAAIVSCFLL